MTRFGATLPLAIGLRGGVGLVGCGLAGGLAVAFWAGILRSLMSSTRLVMMLLVVLGNRNGSRACVRQIRLAKRSFIELFVAQARCCK